MMCSWENLKSNQFKDTTVDLKHTPVDSAADKQVAGKFRLLLAALLLILAFSINSYLAMRASLPAPVDYSAVYDSLNAQ